MALWIRSDQLLDVDAELVGDGRATPMPQLRSGEAAIDHDGDRQAVELRPDPHGSGGRVVADEVAVVDAVLDRRHQGALPTLVEGAKHLADRRMSERTRPGVDPQRP